MNSVMLVGRLTKDPDMFQSEGKTSVARFSMALDRGKDKDGKDRGADFPSIVCFGKTAELVGKYLEKGRLVGITGHITTGSYEKDGHKVYTTEVTADRVEFLSSKGDSAKSEAASDAPVDGFAQISNEEIPF